MKKILGISLMAVLAATPLMARAETIATPEDYALVDGQDDGVKTAESGLAQGTSGVPVAEAGKYFKGKDVLDTDAGHVATASYVKGAYNAAISAVNKVAADAASNMATTLEDYATKEGVAASVDKATVKVTAAGTVASSLSNGSFSGTVTLPDSVTAVAAWGDDSNTTSITLNNASTPTNISGSVSGTVTSTFTGTEVTGDVRADGYYDDADDAAADTFTGIPYVPSI